MKEQIGRPAPHCEICGKRLGDKEIAQNPKMCGYCLRARAQEKAGDHGGRR